jgi:hypothetical protein
MTRRYSGFWLGFTIVLSIIFAALFFPGVYGRYTLTESLTYMGIGVLVIWAVYFARAAIFPRVFSRAKPPPVDRDIVR